MGYVNNLLEFTQTPLGNSVMAFLSFLGISVIGAFAWVIRLYRSIARKDKQHYAMTESLRIINETQAEDIKRYQKLTSQENEDLKTFIAMLPESNDRVHTLYHMMLSFAALAKSGKIIGESGHVIIDKQAIDDTVHFATSLVLIIVKKRLIYLKEYGCARRYVGLSFMGLILPHLARQSSPTIFVPESLKLDAIENFDWDEAKYLYDSLKAFDDMFVIDHFLAAMIIYNEITKSNVEEIVYESRRNFLIIEISNISDRIRKYSQVNQISIPNTMISIEKINSVYETYSNEFNFSAEVQQMENNNWGQESPPRLYSWLFSNKPTGEYLSLQNSLFKPLRVNLNYKI